MPMPNVLARTNRYTFNPIIRLFAGRIAPLALMVHRGRSSGREYRTPILAFPSDGGFVIALVYGRGTDWERNVRAAGGCELVYRGKRHALTDPESIGEEEAGDALPAPVRIALRLLAVHDFLHLAAAEPR